MSKKSKTKASKAAKRTAGQSTKSSDSAVKVPASRKLIPELAAMKLPPKIVSKLEALPEAQQDTVLNYVNSGMKINDAYQRTIAGKPEQQQPEPEAATPAPEVASPEAGSAGQAAAAPTPPATPGAVTTQPVEATQAAEPGTQPEAKKRGRAPKGKTE